MSDEQTLVEITADIVAAHVANNKVPVGDVSLLVANVHAALAQLGAPILQEVAKKTPAVSVRASVKPDHVVCLECGSRQKMLKRHLHTAHGLTPEEYRREFELPKTYPMVAPNYAQQRAELAKRIGLGRKPRERTSEKPQHETSSGAAAKTRRPRTKKA